jgi:apolipoprotein N-acyltransferase
LVTVSWISLSGLRDGADKFMILGGLFTIIIHSALLTLPLILYYYTRKTLIRTLKSATVFTLPFIWVTVEYLYALPEVSFPWLTAGNAFTTALNKIQFIEITGVYGISFWVLIISSIIYLIFEKAVSNKDTFLSLFKRKDVYVLLIIVAILFFLPDLYTIATKSNTKYNNNFIDGKVKVNIIQPNVNPWKKMGCQTN